MRTHRNATTLLAAVFTSAIVVSGALCGASAQHRIERVQHNDQSYNNGHHQKEYRQHASNHQQFAPRPAEYRHYSRPGSHYVHALPAGHKYYRHGGNHYYYHQGVYYTRSGCGYQVIERPRFYHLPSHARRIVVNNVIYFSCDNVYYRSCGDYYEICEEPVVVCEPVRSSHVQSSIEINAGPVTVVLSESCRHR